MRTALLVLALLFPVLAQASEGHGSISPDLLVLAAVLAFARLGGHLATLARQPAVVGELLAGILTGLAVRASGGDVAAFDRPMIQLLAELGVILLLFEVGLESTVGQMLKVGASAALVAVLGVLGPFFLGWGVSALLLPSASLYVHLFLGATLTATSVGITARVLQELGRSRSSEARIILGAAVIDDVLGLVILAAVSGIIAAAGAGQALSAGPILWIAAKAFGFLVVGLWLGAVLTPRVYRGAARMSGGNVLLALSLGFCFLLAGLAGLAGLAPIVGAFAAGLVLEHAHYEDFVARGERELEELVKPLTGFLAPVFFFVMGLRVDVTVFGDPAVLALAAALTAAAIVGKQLSMAGVLDRGASKLAVGVGMIPRGEVGLIFANIGLTLKLDGHALIDAATYGAIVVMVVVTTLVTPPVLAVVLRRVPRLPEEPVG